MTHIKKVNYIFFIALIVASAVTLTGCIEKKESETIYVPQEVTKEVTKEVIEVPKEVLVPVPEKPKTE